MEGEYLSGLTNIASNEGIAIVESSYINNRLHYHKFIELVYFDKGSGYHSIDGGNQRVSRGDLYIINPYVSHEFHADESGVLRVINVMFYADFFDLNTSADKFIGNAFQNIMGREPKTGKPINYIHLHGDRTQGFGELFRNMLTEFQNKEDGYLKVLRNQLSILLIYLFRDYLNDTGKLGLTVGQKKCVEGALEYIDGNFTQNISVDSIASNTGYCSLYFNRLFKLYTGQSIPQYVRNKRLELACRMLAQTDKSIEQICIDVGYSNIKYFYQIFKASKKMTPGEYRKKSEFYIGG